MSLLPRSPATLLIPPANLILRFQSRNAHEPPRTLTLANSPPRKGSKYTISKSATWDRIGAVSGIAFAMLIVVSIQVSLGTSDTTTTPSDIAGISAIDYNQRAEELRLGAFLLTAAVFFLFWFLPLLRHRLEWGQGEVDWPPSVAFGAGLTAGALLLVLAPVFVASPLTTILFLVWVIVFSLVLLYQSFTEDAGYLQ